MESEGDTSLLPASPFETRRSAVPKKYIRNVEAEGSSPFTSIKESPGQWAEGGSPPVRSEVPKRAAVTLRDLIGLVVASRLTGSGWQRREEVEACGEPALWTSSQAGGGDCGCLSTPARGPHTAPTSPKSWPWWLSPNGISPTCCQQTTPNGRSNPRRALRSEGCAATSGLSAGRKPRRPGNRE